MITGYFGVPGCGKTTILTKLAQKELSKIRKGKSNYDVVLTNFYCSGCYNVQLFDFKKYKISNALILFDELTLDADSRSFKSFPHEVKEFIVMHRHLYCDIVYFVQDYSRIDKTIRELTYDLWHVTKPIAPFFRNFSIARRIFRKITVNEMTSDLVMGYRFSTFWERLFSSTCKFTWRPAWYKYFDSFDQGALVSRPELPLHSWEELYVPADKL